MELTSSVLADGKKVPMRYTCDGDNISPPLTWTGVPADTQSLALSVEDPDAPRGTFMHWLIFNLPPDSDGVPVGVPTEPVLPNGARQTMNDANMFGYTGPCPPPGPAHHYIFTLHALDAALTLPPHVSSAQLKDALTGHVLAEARLTTTYQRGVGG